MGKTAVAMGGLAVAGMVAIVLTTASAEPSSTRAKVGCSGQDWGPAVSGLPARLPADGAHYVLSYAARSWRLTVRGEPGTVLSGGISLDRQPHVIRHREWAHRSGRTVTFRTGGSGHARRLDFRSRCATRLRASFTATAGQTVQLGRGTDAPTTDLILRRPPETGVAGRVIRGPTCPVVGPQCPSQPQPAPGDVRIDTFVGDRADSTYVKTIATDDRGRFETDLEPGRYVLTPERGPTSRPSVVSVDAGVISKVELAVDTGIR